MCAWNLQIYRCDLSQRDFQFGSYYILVDRKPFMIAAWMLVAPLDWSFFPGQCWPLLSPVHKVIRTKLRVYLVWIECGTLAQLPWEPFPSDCTLGLNERSCLLAPVWWRTAVPSCQYLCWRLTASAFLPAVTPALTPPTHTPGLTGLVCVRSSLITKLPQLAQASWLVGQKKNPSELSLSLSLFFSVSLSCVFAHYLYLPFFPKQFTRLRLFDHVWINYCITAPRSSVLSQLRLGNDWQQCFHTVMLCIHWGIWTAEKWQ